VLQAGWALRHRSSRAPSPQHPPAPRGVPALNPGLRELLGDRLRGRPAWRGSGCYAPTVLVTQIEVNQFN
jgi:hypothetical protein